MLIDNFFIIFILLIIPITIFFNLFLKEIEISEINKDLNKKKEYLPQKLIKNNKITKPSLVDNIKKKTEKKDNTKAYFTLGMVYNDGKFTKQDYKKALHYFLMAHRQGYLPATIILGDYFQNGKGVEKNYKKAFCYFKLAAIKGAKEAQYNVSLMYYNGHGTKKNMAKALAWLNTYEKNHSDKESKLLKRKIENNITKKETEEMLNIRKNIEKLISQNSQERK